MEWIDVRGLFARVFMNLDGGRNGNSKRKNLEHHPNKCWSWISDEPLIWKGARSSDFKRHIIASN